jgi:transcriptional regulator with XRE-family HTH domain
MISRQLRQLRLARGLSLEALAERLGGVVTRQALWKYEQGKATPSPVVLNRLALALDVKVADLLRAADVRVEFIAYRRRAGLAKRQQEQIESLVAEAVQQRIRVQQVLGLHGAHEIPVQGISIAALDEAEAAAQQMRELWDLGAAPIASVTTLLEDNAVHVVAVDASGSFDGIAAVGRDADGHVAAATVAVRRGQPGERQRLSLAHELGHLVLRLAEGVDAEQAAFRFGAALLAPADAVRAHVGERRAFIQPEELLLLKQIFGMSAQALLYRLRSLGIITESYYRQWSIDINRLGWKQHEPGELPAEEPTWLRRAVLRAVSEELITIEEGARLLGETASSHPASILNRRAFMELPLAERRQLMAEQAAQLVEAYTADADRDLWQGGEIVEP